MEASTEAPPFVAEIHNAEYDDYLDQLAAAPTVPDYFVTQCRERQRRGNGIFGNRYIFRPNAVEGMEEAADGANYAIFESLKRGHEGRDDKRALCLEIAHTFAKAHRLLAQLHHTD